MTTTIKVEYTEQSKCVTSQTKVESDEMSPEDVLALAKKIARQAQDEAQIMTMGKNRS
jgi:hypothetical protein